VIAPPDLSDSVRKVHDFLTVGAAAPLQEAGALALEMPESYYAKLASDYKERRDRLAAILREAGFRPHLPRGAYYIMAGIEQFEFADDVAFVRHLIETAGVAAVPGSSFFEDKKDGKDLIRFCFCKKYETLEEARRRLLTQSLF
jgi:aminotransferase